MLLYAYFILALLSQSECCNLASLGSSATAEIARVGGRYAVL